VIDHVGIPSIKQIYPHYASTLHIELSDQHSALDLELVPSVPPSPNKVFDAFHLLLSTECQYPHIQHISILRLLRLYLML